ncbi:cation:proton antiporter [Aurantimonas marina]|uniref:cation:proton antiporter n=1 Tax=Aurantimonas marina TaxID=2780508 RepID=UPI0019D0C0A8|nr:sodium:proton antiporter [Aurantimonas marina]
MNTPDLFVIAAGIFAYALFSRKSEKGSVTGPIVFTLFGLLIGSAALNLVDLPVENAFINELAEITLVLALFADASRIDIRRLDRQHDVPLRLLGIGLPLAMLLGAGLALLVFPSLGLWQAAILGIILAPTDAALGQAVIANEKIPLRIRQALNVESGLNDGLAFPVLLIAISLAIETQGGRSAGEWGFFVAQQIVLGPVAGLIVGFGGAYLVEFAHRRRWMNHVFLQISVLGLAVLAFSGAELIEGNGFIAAFVAGMVVGTRSRRLLEAIEDFGETEGQLLNLVVFMLFGAILLPSIFSDIGWRHVIYAILSLTLVRMFAVAISLVGTRLLPVTVVFLGWFGPRGLASILYLLLIIERGEPGGMSDVATTVLLTVLLSVLLHGISASPAARAYGRRIEAAGEERTNSERRTVFPFPIRIRRGGRKKRTDSVGDRQRASPT